MDNENSLDRTANLFILSKISTSGASLCEIILSLRELQGIRDSVAHERNRWKTFEQIFIVAYLRVI